ncbi:alpha/beta hydrolase [Flavihumibacter sp. R14]|nr:alpha/beta hydrolase [Flavihumibacter soli]
MTRTTFPVLFFLLILFTGCKKDPVRTAVNLGKEDLTNVRYGLHASQTLDVYLPADRNTATKTIIFVHGGFWIGGDKGDLAGIAREFRDRGYVAVSMNYRLANTAENNVHPAQVTDLGTAINLIEDKADEWKISADKVALAGVSAGGHIALLYTYAYDTGNHVKTVISFAGPANLANMQNASPQQAQVVRWFLGAGAPASVYQQASPLSHVDAATKPTLLLHGKLDAIVPYQQSLELKARLDQFGVKSKLVTYENSGHEADLNAVPGLIAEIDSWLREVN